MVFNVIHINVLCTIILLAKCKTQMPNITVFRWLIESLMKQMNFKNARPASHVDLAEDIKVDTKKMSTVLTVKKMSTQAFILQLYLTTADTDEVRNRVYK